MQRYFIENNNTAKMVAKILLLATVILLVYGPFAQCDESTRQKHALVFGGNGFIGAEVVLRLMDDGYIVTTTNRGNWYWDNPVRVKPRIHQHFACDRDDGIQNCWDLRNYIREVDFFDVVIDFTAFKGTTIDDVMKVLEGKAGLFVVISSDSVYMVSKRDQHQNDDPDSDSATTADDNRPWKEDDAIRPYSATLRERLQDNDPYGHDKLDCEEALVRQRNEGNGIPYVIIRLPDVLGERDTTNRWFPYQVWLQFYKYIQVPFGFSEHLWNLQTSFVYVQDVAEVISIILRLNSTEVVDKVYNVAFEETSSVPQLLQEAQEILQIEGVQYVKLDPKRENEKIPGVLYLFPSVDFGSIDITRAKTLLGWRPTPMKTALQRITAFYKQALGKFPLQRDKAVRTIMQQVVPEEQISVVHDAIEAEIKRMEREVQEEARDQEGGKKDEL